MSVFRTLQVYSVKILHNFFSIQSFNTALDSQRFIIVWQKSLEDRELRVLMELREHKVGVLLGGRLVARWWVGC